MAYAVSQLTTARASGKPPHRGAPLVAERRNNNRVAQVCLYKWGGGVLAIISAERWVAFKITTACLSTIQNMELHSGKPNSTAVNVSLKSLVRCSQQAN